MFPSIPTALLANLATFRHELRAVAVCAPNAGITFLLPSCGMQASVSPEPHLSPVDSGVLRLPAALQTLLEQATACLSGWDTVVTLSRRLDFGLSLHLRRGEQVGQLVIYHNKIGQRTRVVAQGPPSMLSDEARLRLLEPVNDPGTFPTDVRLELMEALLRLRPLLERTGWTAVLELAQSRIINLVVNSGERHFDLVFLLAETDDSVRCAVTSASSLEVARQAQCLLAELCVASDLPTQY